MQKRIAKAGDRMFENNKILRALKIVLELAKQGQVRKIKIEYVNNDGDTVTVSEEA